MDTQLKAKALSLLLCIALLVSVAGCGNNGGKQKNVLQTGSVSAEQSLTVKKLFLPESMNLSTAQCAVGDRIYVGGIGDNAVLGYIEADGSGGKQFALPENCEFVYAICEANANIAVLCGDFPCNYLDANGKPVQNPSPGGKLTLLQYSPNGDLLGRTPLADKYADNGMDFKLMLFKDGCYVLLSQSYLIKIGADGAELGRIAQEGDPQFSSMCLFNGNIIVTRGGIPNAVSQICALDLGPFCLRTEVKQNDSILIGTGISSDGRLLVNDAIGGGGTVSYVDLSSGKTEKVFSWDDLGVAQQSIKRITGLKNGFLYYEPYQNAVYIAESVKAENKRTEIVLATDMIMPELSMLVKDFNSQNKDYKIKVVEYGGGSDKTIDLLNTELISGNAPDVFAFYNYTFQRAEASGAFENLLPYFDNDSEYKRDAVIPSLMDALSRKGKMYWLPYDFSIETFIAPESVIGKRDSLTMKEAEKFASGPGDGISVFPKWFSKSDLLAWMLTFSITRFVNESAGTCDFDNPDFIALLKACNAQRSDESEMPVNADDKSLLKLELLQGFTVYKGLQMGNKENYRFVGFPTEKGSGSVFELGLRLAISSQSKYKDGAWAFVRSAMSKENQQNADFFPVVQSVMDAQIALSLNGELEDKEFGKIKLEQSDAEKLNALIEETTALSSQNETIYTIIVEEAKEYFAGNKTAEACARLIQNRVRIFLAEQK